MLRSESALGPAKSNTLYIELSSDRQETARAWKHATPFAESNLSCTLTCEIHFLSNKIWGPARPVLVCDLETLDLWWFIVIIDHGYFYVLMLGVIDQTIDGERKSWFALNFACLLIVVCVQASITILISGVILGVVNITMIRPMEIGFHCDGSSRPILWFRGKIRDLAHVYEPHAHNIRGSFSRLHDNKISDFRAIKL